jgi:outer membrane protein OmpA-like peptidoglycan-associated protein
MPIGVGLQFKVIDELHLVLNSQYRVPVSENATYHLYHSFGITQSLRKKEVPVPVPVPVAPVVLDRDGDGVPDADDKCPDVAGLATLQGCPDKDADGIADGDDKCPDVAGIAKYQGCPIPDTDGDGINDEEDKCPTVAGVARYQGCPVPDTDGDGINDEEDKCPTRAGTAANQGCPEIAKEVIEKVNMAAKNVFFATGSYKLLAKSFKSLTEVADIMKADESLMIDIDGHTDDVGTNESNQLLSENRAKAVRDYLVSKGVAESRMKSTGYGEEKPVADNKTVAGRAKNRRTEMTVRNY